MATKHVRNKDRCAHDVGSGAFLEPGESRKVENTAIVAALIADGKFAVVKKTVKLTGNATSAEPAQYDIHIGGKS
ncbi:MAG: hypothetical protein JHC87_01830 [Thermoleophilaceae bacterium]|nr:hypothetical protein [Thermoleophilaceae bacterium]